MNGYWTWLLLVASVAALPQQPVTTSAQEDEVMLVGVSRDDSMFEGGIGSAKWTGKGTVAVEPLARITSSGKWKSLPCDRRTKRGCRKFAREYLNKAHTYTVVSADGNGALVQAAPVTLSECYGYSGAGTYSGASIVKSAVAASSVDFFSYSAPPQNLDRKASAPIRKALAALIPKKLDSVHRLRLLSLELEGHKMVIAQRAFTDYTPLYEQEKLRFIFAIGAFDQGHLQVLHWKQNTDDEEERVLGTIHLKSGRDFLITVVTDPESQSFRVYGIQAGRLALVYSGGGSSC